MKTIDRNSRISSLSARIRDTHCRVAVASLIATMTARRDPEAVTALIGLLDVDVQRGGLIGRALVRFGEGAEDALKEFAAAETTGEGDRWTANRLLSRIAYRARLRELGCF